jgi:hypothetical protein
MARSELTTSAIINMLPQSLKPRFYSLGKYVRGVIEEEADELGRAIELTDEDVRSIQLAAFVYMLDDFLRTGSRVAREASVTFEEIGLNGFQIGSTVFTKDNYNTRRGEELADRLRAALVGTPLANRIDSATTMRGLISALIRETTDDTRVD